MKLLSSIALAGLASAEVFFKEDFSASLESPTENPDQAGTREISSELPAVMDTFLASPSHGLLFSVPTTTRPRTGRIRVKNHHEDQDQTPAKRRK